MWESFVSVFGGCFGLVCALFVLMSGCVIIIRVFKL